MSVARRCDSCKEVVDRPQLVHSLTTRTRDQQRYSDFCSDECAIEWLEARIENRRRKAAIDEQARANALPPPAEEHEQGRTIHRTGCDCLVCRPATAPTPALLAPRGYGQ